MRNIVKNVWSFIDNITNGLVDKDLIDAHKIPHEIIDVIKSPNHPSYKKIRNDLFVHIMENIGYYEHIKDERFIILLANNISYALEHPSEFSKVKNMQIPKFIYGVQEALDAIQNISLCNNFCCNMLEGAESITASKGDRCFNIHMEQDWRLNNSEDINVNGAELKLGNLKFLIPKDGSHLHSLNRNFTGPDIIDISVNKLMLAGTDIEENKYYRYITPVSKKTEITSEIGWRIRDVFGNQTYSIEVQLENTTLIVFLCTYDEKKYLIIDSLAPLVLDDMQECTSSLLTALGMITGDIHLNESWLFSYNDEEFKSLYGINYRSLAPSIHCDYQIFTTNVYSALVPIARRIDATNGENRAVKIIGHLHLSNALPQLGFEKFSCLVRSFEKYEKLKRGIFLILSGSQYPLEIQPGSYSIALETIANLTSEIIGNSQDCIIDNVKWENSGIKEKFTEVLSAFVKKGVLNEKDQDNFQKKINSMNKNFNSDRLKALLLYYKYPLSKFDLITLDARNTLLHGSIHPKQLNKSETDTNLLQLSLNLHKLCCALALLVSGYKGYILNNRKLYGFDKSCKSFIKISD